jgi:hypothetical protein
MIFGLRNWIRVLGVFLAACGAVCIPKGAGGHPYYFTLTFSYLVESGALFRLGLALFLVGIAVIILSFIRDPFRRKSTDPW